jgi:hypothetical protein
MSKKFGVRVTHRWALSTGKYGNIQKQFASCQRLLQIPLKGQRQTDRQTELLALHKTVGSGPQPSIISAVTGWQ